MIRIQRTVVGLVVVGSAALLLSMRWEREISEPDATSDRAVGGSVSDLPAVSPKQANHPAPVAPSKPAPTFLEEIDRAASMLEQKAASDPQQAALKACSQNEEHCASLYLDIVNFAAASTDLHGAAVRLWDKTKLDERAARQTSEGLASELHKAQEDPNPYRRIAILSFLEGYESQVLPESAYSDLALRSLAESRLLARRHITNPLPSAAIAEEFAELALKMDSRVRREAFRALGHSTTAAQLDSALSEAPLDPADWMHVGIALRKCGGACVASLDRVLSLDDRRLRETLYEQIGFGDPVLASRLLAVDVSGDEAALRREFLRDTTQPNQ